LFIFLSGLLACGCGGRGDDESKIPEATSWPNEDKLEVAKLAKKGLAHLKPLLKSKKTKVRMVAISALGEIRDNPKATALLLEAVNGKDPHDVYWAIIALGRQGAPQAKGVIERFMESQDTSLVKAACSAIGEYGDKSLYPLLDQALDDEDPGVQSHAKLIKDLYGIE